MRKRGFAIAGKTIEKYRPAGVQRRSALFDDAVFKGQFAEGLADALEADQFVGQLLQVHLVGEFLQGDGSGSDIAQPLQRLDRPALALLGERVAHINLAVGVAHPQGAQQLPLNGHPDQLGHDMVRQLDGIDDLTGGFQVACIDQLHHQAEKIKLVDSGGRDIRGLSGNALQKGVQRPLVDGSEGHQIFAQTAAIRGHTLERLGHILGSDQIRLCQQIAQLHSRADDVLLATASSCCVPGRTVDPSSPGNVMVAVKQVELPNSIY